MKRAALGASKKLGVFSVVRDSRWRSQRLLILGYHGISLDDEHEWNPHLYMSQDDFANRMALLKSGGYRVLPLDLALRLLRDNELPSKSVVLTFDDGFYDFYERAHPILRQFGYPATLYLTTYYCGYNKPVFDVICAYLLWKGRGAIINGTGMREDDGDLDLRTPAGRTLAYTAIYRFAHRSGFTAERKNELAATLAERVGVSYDDILTRRILHLMSPDEIRQLPDDGVDIQLHTHRHRTPLDRALFLRELSDNTECIVRMTDPPSLPTHFCYPSGVHRPEFLPWLREAGVVSATTCAHGMASRRSDPLLLPRLLDTSEVAPIEFEGWLAGVAALLPRRPQLTPGSPYPA